MVAQEFPQDFAQSNNGTDSINAPNPSPQTERGPSQVSGNQVTIDRTPLDLVAARAALLASDVFEAVAEGPETPPTETPSTSNEAANMQELVLRLRGLRREKESLLPLSRELETPSQILMRVNDEVRDLQAKLTSATAGREAAVAWAVGSDTLEPAERERLQKLTELEAKDSLHLEGLEIREALQELSAKLKSIETDKTMQNVMTLIETQNGPLVSQMEKDSLLASLEQVHNDKPGTEKQNKTGDGFLEIYSEISKTAGHDIEGLLKRFNQLNEKVGDLENIVGVESFGSLTFCYNDIVSALTHLTERLLLLDPRRMETLATKASEVATELDKAMAMKAKIGGEVGYNPVVASEQKIEALYGLLENWAPTAHALPKLINKMKYISVLSRDTAELDARMQHVESDLIDVKALLESSERSLELVNSKTDEQIKLMRELLAKLDG